MVREKFVGFKPFSVFSGFVLCFCGKYSMCTWKEYIFYCYCIDSSINAKLGLINGCYSAFLYTCWLSICSNNYWVRGVKIPPTIVDLPVSSLSSISFKYFKAPLLTAYMFRITVSSWWIDTFITMRYLSLPLVIFFALKSLFDINRVYPDFLWLVFPCCIIFHLVNFILFLSLYLKWISLEAICSSFLLLYINW